MPLFKRSDRKGKSDPWYAKFRGHNNNWVRKNTGFTDRALAEAKLRQLQGEALDPDGAAQNVATLEDALDLLLTEKESQAKAEERSQATFEFYNKKCSIIVAVLGHKLPLRNITASTIDKYIQTRREGAGKNTISKELGTLRLAMKMAARARIWKGDMSIFPIAFSPGYEPRKRFLTPSEVGNYAAVMRPEKFAILAFAIATSAEWSALWRAVPVDIAEDFTTCRVRGSKNKNRDRLIPILLPAFRELLRIAKNHAAGETLLFRYVSNFRRDLNHATALVYPCKCPERKCAKCVAVRVSPNDLRRTHAKWLKLANVRNEHIAPLLGHADSRMVDRVYGRMTAMELAPQLIRQLEGKKE